MSCARDSREASDQSDVANVWHTGCCSDYQKRLHRITCRRAASLGGRFPDTFGAAHPLLHDVGVLILLSCGENHEPTRPESLNFAKSIVPRSGIPVAMSEALIERSQRRDSKWTQSAAVFCSLGGLLCSKREPPIIEVHRSLMLCSRSAAHCPDWRSEDAYFLRKSWVARICLPDVGPKQQGVCSTGV